MRRFAFGSLLFVSLLLMSGAPQAATPKVGDTVWAQWAPNSWYHGKAAKACPLGLQIAFDDGDTACISPALMAVDKAPTDGVKAGTRVLAKWTDGKLYPATVTGVEGKLFAVRYDDRATGKVGAADLRLLAVTTPPKSAKAGDVVWAQWTPNGWFHGKADKACPLGLHVQFDDGDQACFPSVLIVVDSAPAKGTVKVGARVLSKWSDGRLYPATITTVAGDTFLVRYDDGATGSVPLADVRLMAKP